ncbi:MAG: exopolysaccharide biosynthesis protein [Balneolales bacterium]
MKQNITSVEQLIDCIEKVGPDKERVSIHAIIDAVGQKSLGPLLLIAGLITLAPLVGDIPGVPTVLGIFVLITAGQLLIFREELWLPKWILNRTLPRRKLHRALGWIRRPAHFFDRFFRPRFTFILQGFGLYLIAMSCIIVALVMPIMEFIPFSANAAGIALSAFGLALINRDGFLASLALLITGTTIGMIIYYLL